MSEPPADLRSDYYRVPSRAIRVALVVSALLHALVIWGWLPRPHRASPDHSGREAGSGRLQVQLAPPAASPPAPPPAVPAQPSARAETPPPVRTPRAPSRPPALALDRPAPGQAPVAPAPPPAEARPAPAGDLSSYIAAQRRARGEVAPDIPPEPAPAPSPERTGDSRDQIVAANLGLGRTPAFGDDPRTGRGIFQIKRMGYDDAEFLFFGWNRDIRRNTAQLVEVRRGSNSSMQIAVVRRMIQIIRENTDGDFLWISHRLGRDITLSARPQDTAGLEDFLMQEFFSHQGRQ